MLTCKGYKNNCINLCSNIINTTILHRLYKPISTKKMKKLNAYVEGQQSGKVIGNIINLIIAISGAIYCVYGIYIQFINL